MPIGSATWSSMVIDLKASCESGFGQSRTKRDGFLNAGVCYPLGPGRYEDHNQLCRRWNAALSLSS